MSWEMFAAPLGNEDWTGVGDEWYARQHGKPTPVTVTEDPDGPYLGWIDAEDEAVCGAAAEPEMVQRKEIFSIQFPYGYQAEQEHGRGRAIRLRIEERS